MSERRLLARLPEYAAIAVLVAGTAWLGGLVRHNYVEHGASEQAAGRVAAPAALPAADASGDPVSVRLNEHEGPVLLLVLSTQCPFCEENMDSWRSLVNSWRAASPGAEVLALSIGTSEQTRTYLAAHRMDVPFHTITPAVLPLLGATGYPTTAVFVPADRSLAVWGGVLGEAERIAILGIVGSGLGSVAAGGM